MNNHKIKPSEIKLAFWNANSLNPQRFELQEFAKRHNLDVTLINETHLKPCHRDPKIANYTLYRRDRLTGPAGGTAIYVRRSLEHYEVATPQLAQVEANTIEMITQTGSIRFVSIYKPPRNPLDTNDLTQLLNSGIPTIIAGDLNSKHPSWNSRLINACGRTLRNYADTEQLAVHGPDEPTHYHYAGFRPDVLDILIAKNITMPIELGTVSELDSDHNPVLVYMNNPTARNDNILRQKTDWSKYTQHVNNNIICNHHIMNINDLEQAVDSLTNCIKTAVQVSTDTWTAPNTRADLPPRIRQLIQERNRARRAWQRNYDLTARSDMHRLAHDIKNAIREHQDQTWTDKVASLTTRDNSVWKMIRALNAKKISTPPIHGPNGICHSPANKAEAFGDCMELQCSPNFQHADLDHIEEIEQSINELLEVAQPDKQTATTPKEIQEIIRKLPTKKAAGPDGITNTALKRLGKKGIAAITNLINAAMRLKHFPRQWKTADVIMIPKPNQNMSFPQNYRPISLLSCLGKIYEKTILTRLQNWTENNHTIPPEQHGFRKHHSTNHQLLRVTEYITEGFNRRQATGAIFLDVAKAFDKVWHDGLIYKLLTLGAPKSLVEIIWSYLSDRQLQVKLENCRSRPKPITAGVPQGSLLSPILFNIYTHDIPRTPNTMLAMYADDTAILTRSIRPYLITKRLQEAADNLEEWYRKWRIDVNATKSTAFFATKRRLKPEGQIEIFNEDIPWKDTAKYLGLTYDRRLNWTAHTKSTTAKAKAAMAKLYPIINRRSRLSLNNKIMLLKTIIRPILTYGAPTWAYMAQANTHALQVVQNKFLRMATDSPWYLRNNQIHRDLNIEELSENIRSQAIKFMKSCKNHSQDEVKLASCQEKDRTPKYHKPSSILNQT